MGSPFIVAYLLGRGIRNRAYWKSLPERLGFLPFKATAPGSIWLHAVSVGEVLSAVGLIARLRSEFPDSNIYVSISTIAGRKLAGERLPHLVDGLFFAPLDFTFAVRRVLRALEPSLVVVMETEIWPNLFREAKRFGAQLVIVNGRISDRAWPKYRSFRWFFHSVLNLPDKILTQSGQDTDRYLKLGAPSAKVSQVGNLKYDVDPSAIAIPEVVVGLIERTAPDLLLIAASTMPGMDSADTDEDDAVVNAFADWSAKFPKLLLVLVPRRPERFDRAAQQLSNAKIRFVRRSKLEGHEILELPAVLLLDTMGELGSLFPLADLVFMGGSIAQRGGHNILEPAYFGKPIIAGPHMENFAEIARDFTQGGGLVRFQSPQEFASCVAELLGDKPRRDRIGKRAQELANAQRGATDRILNVLGSQFDIAVPVCFRKLWQRLLLTPVAYLWRSISGWNVRRKAKRAGHAATAVVSVGGLGMGGAGKTPFVLWLAAKLKESGASPAFLTRGYRRKSADRISVLAPNDSCSVALTGEEAQMLVRSGLGPVGISANRLEAAHAVEERFHPSVFLLDDGFQHTQLARNVDIVLIDTLNPIPWGRLREGPEALARASIIVLTRCARGRNYAGLIAYLRKWNKVAPMFLSRVSPVNAIVASASQRVPLDSLVGLRVAAFCGLGNPSSFWKTLEQLKYNTVYRWDFGDHHHYKPQELRRLEQQALHEKAEILLTTQKDFLNLPPSWLEVMENLPVYWLDVALEVDNADQLLEVVAFQLKQNSLHM